MIALAAAAATGTALAIGLALSAGLIARNEAVEERNRAAMRMEASGGRARRNADGRARRGRTRATLERAGIDLEPETWTAWRCGASAFVGFGAALLAESPGVGIACALACLAGSEAWALARGSRRKGRFAEQLSGVLRQTAESMRGGLSVDRALVAAGTHMPDPSGAEFGRLGEEMAAGRTLSEALETLMDRTGDEDLKLVVAIVEVTKETGGSAASQLEGVAETIDSRIAVQRHLRAQTSTARASMVACAAAPWAGMALSSLPSPAAMEFWTSNPIGWAVIACVAVAEALGVLLLRRMMRLEA